MSVIAFYGKGNQFHLPPEGHFLWLDLVLSITVSVQLQQFTRSQARWQELRWTLQVIHRGLHFFPIDCILPYRRFWSFRNFRYTTMNGPLRDEAMNLHIWGPQRTSKLAFNVLVIGFEKMRQRSGAIVEAHERLYNLHTALTRYIDKHRLWWHRYGMW